MAQGVRATTTRKALAGATCAHQGLTATNVQIAFLAPGNRDLRDLARVFSLDLGPLRPFLERHGLTPEEPISPLYAKKGARSAARLADLIDDGEFQEAVRLQTRPCGLALERYLEKKHFFAHPDVGLVDVGWLGTIPRFLFEAVQHRVDRPRFHGFLMGASRGIEYPSTPDNSIEGLIYDGDRFDFAGSLINYALDLFEESFRGPHAGLEGYRLKDDEGYDLVFRDAQTAAANAEALQSAYYAPLQEGILAAAPRYGAAAAVLGFKAGELKPWSNYLLTNKLAFPRAQEVALLRFKHHVNELSGDHRPPRRFARAQKSLWNRPAAALRWLPGLRMKYYLRHAVLMLRR